MSPPSALKRCAIYTRKSTEHNLDLEFNSLHAQREACEAYIKSQTHEGWRLVEASYDDGGISGASLERPDIQRLITDIQSGRIDIVVVYKVDRLTRSLSDFAKLVEIFDRHGVSFVSVTQAFNTTTSMGRLTLNVLLSFAQFEREVIGERVRDKIAASKRKGIWVGGPLPMGYECRDRKVVIVPDHAETVRYIFRTYLEVGSVGQLKENLEQKDIRTSQRLLSTGRIRGGVPFSMNGLTHLLQNRFYIGEYEYRGEICQGEHQPIIERALFDAVQAKIAENRVETKLRQPPQQSILTGRIFDDRGNRMTPVHTVKKGVRYRYYVSQALLQRRSEKVGGVRRVSAPDIEKLVIEALSSHLNVTSQVDKEFMDDNLDGVTIAPDCVAIRLSTGRDNLPKILNIPWKVPVGLLPKGTVSAPNELLDIKPESQEAILTAVSKARKWLKGLQDGSYRNWGEIARQECLVERHVRLLAPLAFVEPNVLQAVLAGTAPASITVTALARKSQPLWNG